VNLCVRYFVVFRDSCLGCRSSAYISALPDSRPGLGSIVDATIAWYRGYRLDRLSTRMLQSRWKVIYPALAFPRCHLVTKLADRPQTSLPTEARCHLEAAWADIASASGPTGERPPCLMPGWAAASTHSTSSLTALAG
jgi:hypothetical protein